MSNQTTERPPTIYLSLAPLADETPWPSRVKRALKCLLRSFKLRARAWADAKDLPPDFVELTPDE